MLKPGVLFKQHDKLKKLNLEPRRIIQIQLFFVLFERFFIQLGLPGSIIYLMDLANVYLLIVITKKQKHKRFNTYIIIYTSSVVVPLFVAFINYMIYGNNLVFTLLEIRNIFRFLVFFLAMINYCNDEMIYKVFSVYEIFFWINSLYIIYQYFTFFPADAYWMRGDLLNGFFGTARGGNAFVNIQMLIIVFYKFISWTKKRTHFVRMMATLSMSLIIAGMIELKAFFVEIAVLYLWYLIRIKKTKKECILNVVIICSFVAASYAAIQLMIKEYPWFKNTFSIKGIIDNLTSDHYASDVDINRFTGVFAIAEKIFHNSIIKILFGIGLGNGAVTYMFGKTTVFAEQYIDYHYSWYQGTYLFVQSGLVGLFLYLTSFVYLLKEKKNRKQFADFSNMMILVAIFLVFYGEALRTDAGYMLYFAIGTGFSRFKRIFYEKGLFER